MVREDDCYPSFPSGIVRFEEIAASRVEKSAVRVAVAARKLSPTPLSILSGVCLLEFDVSRRHTIAGARGGTRRPHHKFAQISHSVLLTHGPQTSEKVVGK